MTDTRRYLSATVQFGVPDFPRALDFYARLFSRASDLAPHENPEAI